MRSVAVQHGSHPFYDFWVLRMKHFGYDFAVCSRRLAAMVALDVVNGGDDSHFGLRDLEQVFDLWRFALFHSLPCFRVKSVQDVS